MSRRADLAAAGLIVVAGVALDLHVFGANDVTGWLPDILVGATLVGCAVAVRTRGEQRTGLLLGAAGAAWFAGGLFPAIALLHRGPVTHALLVGRDGRVRDRLGRAAVAAGYATALVPALWTNVAATAAVGGALTVAGVVRVRSARGELRRRRAAGARLLGIWFAGLVTLSAVYTVVPERDADAGALLAYEALIVAVALSVAVLVARTSGPRTAVTDLVVELGEERSGALSDALATALGDPTLEVGFRSADRYLDAAGKTVYVDAAPAGRAVTPIDVDGTVVAVLVHDRALLDDPALSGAVAIAARLLRQNARLQADVQAQVVELQASRRRLVRAADQARSRLEAGLHEGTQQRLTRLAERLASRSTSDGPLLARAQEQLAHTRDELDRLAAGLHPRVLSERGLAEALRELGEHGDLQVAVLDVPSTPDLPPDVAAAVWFVCSEAVANTVKHGRASAVTIEVCATNGVVIIDVRDDGVGGADPSGSGLRGLRDRLEAYGGQLRIDSVPGRGTALHATLPLVTAR